MANVIKLEGKTTTLSTDEMKAFLSTNLRELRRYGFSLTRNMDDADDLIQTVVERLLKKPIPVDANPKAWVFRVCRNAWIDELRSRKVRQSDDSNDTLEIEDESESTNPINHLQQIELEKAIDSLAEPFRTVIKLIIIAGLSYAEAAESLDIPIGTVMSRVARARQQLKLKLGSVDSG